MFNLFIHWKHINFLLLFEEFWLSVCICDFWCVFQYWVYLFLSLFINLSRSSYWLSILFLQLIGTSQAPKAGTDVLLDLLSIGSPPVQNNSTPSDILSSSQDNKSSVAILDGLSPTPSGGAASMIDLLDGFVPNSPKPGKSCLLWKVLLCCYVFFITNYCPCSFEQRTMVQLIHL